MNGAAAWCSDRTTVNTPLDATPHYTASASEYPETKRFLSLRDAWGVPRAKALPRGRQGGWSWICGRNRVVGQKAAVSVAPSSACWCHGGDRAGLVPLGTLYGTGTGLGEHSSERFVPGGQRYPGWLASCPAKCGGLSPLSRSTERNADDRTLPKPSLFFLPTSYVGSKFDGNRDARVVSDMGLERVTLASRRPRRTSYYSSDSLCGVVRPHDGVALLAPAGSERGLAGNFVGEGADGDGEESRAVPA